MRYIANPVEVEAHKIISMGITYLSPLEVVNHEIRN